MTKRPPVVAIAGASGFIGSALSKALAESGMHVLALSRSPSSRERVDISRAGISVRPADLFSVEQVERALEDADFAVYLVHSMLPSARLMQGSFEDFDFLLADNFARVARAKGLARIIYVAGLIPETASQRLSKHLKSRLEVERVLASAGVPVVVLRAGLVVGRGGSSLRIMVNLVRRLPVMICPRWTRSLCQPIALSDLVTLIKNVAMDPDLAPGAYDVAGPERLTYQQMLVLTATTLGLRRLMLPFAWFSTRLSALWVSLFSGTSMALVQPLVESLHGDMIAKDRRLNERYGLPGRSFADALSEAVHSNDIARGRRKAAPLQEVCSVQRLDVPPGRGGAWVATTYARWLTLFLHPIVHAGLEDGGRVVLYVKQWRRGRIELLTLELDRESPVGKHSSFSITGGVLARLPPLEKSAGRVEFRKVPGRDQVIVAVLEYRPSLPWWIYKMTQAPLHRFVMRRFGRHLRKLAVEERKGFSANERASGKGRRSITPATSPGA